MLVALPLFSRGIAAMLTAMRGMKRNAMASSLNNLWPEDVPIASVEVETREGEHRPTADG